MDDSVSYCGHLTSLPGMDSVLGQLDIRVTRASFHKGDNWVFYKIRTETPFRCVKYNRIFFSQFPPLTTLQYV